jgi:hypothetical protein
MTFRKNTILTGLVIALGATAPVLAGTATITSKDGNSATFEYTDTMLRMGTGDDSTYVVVRDGSLYTVSMQDGQAMVFDAGSMMRGLSGSFAQMAPSDLNQEFVSLDKTGRSETIAGIRGDVYELRFRDDKGREQSEEIVLSTDRRAREFRDAMYLMLDAFSDVASKEAMQQSKDIQSKLTDMDVGVLRYGSEMTLTAIDGDAVALARFELPAEPMDMQGLGNMLGSMGAQGQAPADDASSGEKKGLFSSMMGAIGNKADRQADRAGDSVEREIDEETDEQVDNAIGKAFGKLFGR